MKLAEEKHVPGNMTHDLINIIIGVFCFLTLLAVSITILFIKTNNNKSCNLKLLKHKLKKS